MSSIITDLKKTNKRSRKELVMIIMSFVCAIGCFLYSWCYPDLRVRPAGGFGPGQSFSVFGYLLCIFASVHFAFWLFDTGKEKG